MDALIDLDRRITRTLGRCFVAWEEQTGQPVHALAFWLTAATYLLVWVALGSFASQPLLLWFIVSGGMGAIATWVTDREPVAPLERKLAATHFGLDSRWALHRLGYVVLALILLVPLLFDGQNPPGFVVLGLVEVLLFALLEYLLTFRVVEDEQALNPLQEALAAAMKAAREGPGVVVEEG